MKLQPDKSTVQTITGHGPGWIGVDGEKITSSVIVSSGGTRIAWPVGSFDALEPGHFAALAQVDAEIVIFGSGARIRFPRPAWLAPLIERRIGVETMDTPAACRTYNILAQEGRNVAVALLVEQPV
ncbi:Mth938-like domain-containing protein [Caenimonas aquaedulcis]|uniref:Mth938-like domain-containing protein n=1 Tax=Caenimonas aquaedulcis TaxID=2793270 RepID=A0A931H2C0_9BURK|nr:Mth938-like domain-containing protein [Caenimonas aquaedulcis]MBG9387292.1 Mth938-like domain-containing protein [Caenimonas aquaedulcis]